MNRSTQIFALTAMFITPLGHARECSPPPVRNSEQALCYATAYADKNGLAHGSSVTKKVAKSKVGWVVRFTENRRDAKAAGWEVDVDAASGTVTRFTGYKGSTR